MQIFGVSLATVLDLIIVIKQAPWVAHFGRGQVPHLYFASDFL